MIILSGLGNISLGPLLVAGLVPGVLLAIMLSIVPVARCIMNPSLGTLLKMSRGVIAFLH